MTVRSGLFPFSRIALDPMDKSKTHCPEGQCHPIRQHLRADFYQRRQTHRGAIQDPEQFDAEGPVELRHGGSAEP